MLFDSHCHLTAPELAGPLANILQRAAEAGVGEFLNISDSLENSLAVAQQAEQATVLGFEVWATAGVHPQQALTFSLDDSAEALLRCCGHPLVKAIGEIGLDAVYDDNHPQFRGASMAVQEQVLRAQLEVAAQLNLPVILHNRNADEALLRVLEDGSPLPAGGVLHCFGSSLETARRALNLGLYLGFTGLVTFKSADAVREAAAFCPLDRMLVETDSPYLAPVPWRGKTNEPSYLPWVARGIAGLRRIAFEEFAEVTTANVKRMLRIHCGPTLWATDVGRGDSVDRRLPRWP